MQASSGASSGGASAQPQPQPQAPSQPQPQAASSSAASQHPAQALLGGGRSRTQCVLFGFIDRPKQNDLLVVLKAVSGKTTTDLVLERETIYGQLVPTNNNGVGMCEVRVRQENAHRGSQPTFTLVHQSELTAMTRGDASAAVGARANDVLPAYRTVTEVEISNFLHLQAFLGAIGFEMESELQKRVYVFDFVFGVAKVHVTVAQVSKIVGRTLELIDEGSFVEVSGVAAHDSMSDLTLVARDMVAFSDAMAPFVALNRIDMRAARMNAKNLQGAAN